MKIIKSLFLGILAASLALTLEFYASYFASESLIIFFSLSIFLLVSAFLEEASKLAIIYQEFKSFSRQKAVFYSLFVGLGFSSLEIYFNALSNPQASLFLPAYLGIILIHCLTSAIAGFSVSKKEEFSWISLASILMLNSILHIIYNLIILNFS